MNEVTYYAFDPGETVGWARFNQTGQLIAAGQVKWVDLTDWLEHQPVASVKVVIVEEYKVFRHKAKAHIGSKIETVQSIGMIRSWCTRNELSIVFQPSSILSIAEKWAQIKIPSNHSISHQVCATLHGLYWLIKHGVTKTALELENEERT